MARLITEGEVALPAGYRWVGQLREERSGDLWVVRRDDDQQLLLLRILPASVAQQPLLTARLRHDVGQLVDRLDPALLEPIGVLESTVGCAVISEFHDGVRLDELLASGPKFSIGAAVVIIVDILDALASLHHCGVLHRDVRPGVVLIEPSGHARLGDAGIAAPLFRQHDASGTAQYLAPELWDEEPASEASDIYAAAAVAFHVLAGSPPFPATRLQALRAAHLRRAAPLELLPDSMRTVIGQGLAKTAGGRPLNAASYRDALRRHASRALGGGWEFIARRELGAAVAQINPLLASTQLGNATVSDVPASPRSRQPARHKMELVGVVTSVVALLIAGLGGSYWISSGNQRVAEVRVAAARTVPAAAASASPMVVAAGAAVVASTPSPTPTPTAIPTPRGRVVVTVVTPPPIPSPTAAPTPAPSPSAPVPTP